MKQEFKLSISNIAWSAEDDNRVYALMQELGFTGLEIAPTRIFPEAPYEHIAEAKEWAGRLYETHGFTISSMQSIWYGKKEKVFGSDEERAILTDYTKRAIDFAAAIGCGNLVFGSPVNRQIPDGMSADEVADKSISFFAPLGAYAHEQGTRLSMEANPPIYNTNFINDTQAALEFLESVSEPGFCLNLDVGTMIANNEKADAIFGRENLQRDNLTEDGITNCLKMPSHTNQETAKTKNQTRCKDGQIDILRYLNHVHISEPGLGPIEKRELHRELLRCLKEAHYDRYISIEMGNPKDPAPVREAMEYVKRMVYCLLRSK